MITNLIFLHSLSFVFLLYLIHWNWKDGYDVHKWSGDAKNVRLFLTRINAPQSFEKDFVFNRKLNLNLYLPLPLSIISWIQQKIGNLPATIFILQITLAIVFVFGWTSFAYLATMSVSSAFISLFLATPMSSTLAGDGISGPLPGNWTPRFWSNALTPFLLVLLFLSFQNHFVLLLAAVLSGIIFNLHPVGGIGGFIFLFLTSTIQFWGTNITPFQFLLSLAINFSLTIPYILTYFRNSAASSKLSLKERRTYNVAGKERILLWPSNYSLFERYLTHRGQLASGCAYIAISIGLYLYSRNAGIQQYYLYQSFINLLFISILINRHEPWGYIVLIFALFGLLGINKTNIMPVTVILIVTSLIYRYKRYSFQPLFILLFLVSGIASSANNGYTYSPQITNGIHSVFLLSVPLIFSAYLIGCTLFHWYLPFRANKLVSFIDWGRILKAAIYPVLFLALFAIKDLSSLIFTLPNPHKILAILCILTPVFCAWRYKIGYLASIEEQNDIELFSWIKKNLPLNTCFHVVSNLPPYQDPEKEETSTFAFRLRANTLRSITWSWKDGGISFCVSPELFFHWQQRREEIKASVMMKHQKMYSEHARRYGADYLIVSNNLLSEPTLQSDALKVFPDYTIFQV